MSGRDTAMELGITSFAETPPTGANAIGHGERLRNVIAEVEQAEAVGLDVYGLGEHHRPDMAAAAPAMTLAAAAARTARIRLSSAVIVLSSADPVRTFQDFATLDLISSGRAELMVGRGSFIESFPLFGYSLEDYDELFTEKLELLLEIRDAERVTWSGKFRPPLEDQAVYPRPHQDPLPIWIAVGGTPESMVRAGRLGLPVALAIIGGDPARFAVLVDIYTKALVESGCAGAIAGLLVRMTESLGPYAALAAVYIMTSLLAAAVTNNAAAALVFPFAVAIAQNIGANPRTFVMIVAFAASASFISPLGYQTNLMVYGPGGYRLMDYVKVGLPLNILLLVCATILVPWAWPF